MELFQAVEDLVVYHKSDLNESRKISGRFQEALACGKAS